MLMLYLAKWLAPALMFDPLLMKNLVFLFGHTLVNITMFLGIAVVYELLPGFSGRPCKTNRIVALSWNLTFMLVLVAFFYHLYMEFVQPLAFQYLGSDRLLRERSPGHGSHHLWRRSAALRWPAWPRIRRCRTTRSPNSWRPAPRAITTPAGVPPPRPSANNISRGLPTPTCPVSR